MSVIIAIARFLLGWVVASVVTAVVAVVFQTQNIVSRLNAVGGDVGFSDRMSSTVYDLTHFGPHYFLPAAAGLLVAFAVGAVVYYFAKVGRPVVFAVAGAVAILVMLVAMKNAFFGVQLVGGARDGVGFAFQLLAGAIGGLVFARLTRPKPTSSLRR